LGTDTLVAAHVTVLEGDGQTGPAGTVLPIALVVEVRDQHGNVMAGKQLEIAEISAVDGHIGDAANLTPTDQAGLSRYPWQPSENAGVHRLRVVAYKPNGSDIAAADTVTATVTPGPPARLTYTTPQPPSLGAFLGNSIDLAAVVDSVLDLYGNRITVQMMTVDADPPLTVSGTTVASVTEIDAVPKLVINGVQFNFPVHFNRDLRELAGAHGGWVCAMAPGWTPGVGIIRRDATFTVDSVVYSSGGFLYKFYSDLHWTDLHEDGSTTTGGQLYIRNVVLESPGSWFWEYGPVMSQTSASPLTYTQSEAQECISWSAYGAMNNQALWISK
jgi:hypothetical protein